MAQCAPEYNFTRDDVELHVIERFAKLLPLVTEATSDIDLIKATIGGKTISWPARIDSKDLPWLYHEVFDAFETNPSSYDHPDLDYQGRKWVVDAGAAEGYFSLFSLEHSLARVIAVEPLALMKSALERTLKHHSRGQETTVVTVALSDAPGWSNS